MYTRDECRERAFERDPGREAMSVSELSDSELAERVQKGDQPAFSELVKRYMRRAFSVAYRLMRQREDAEDLVQETFVTVHQKINTFDTGRPFGPWFFRVLVNKGINARKSRQIRSTEPVPPDARDAGASPAQTLERREISQAFGKAFDSLTERQQMVVRLFELEGFSSAEIGEILDLSDGTVRWHLHQARMSLREALAPLKESSR
jgi:RNA polymerase sigma-70 factor, ECF subfamily